MKIKLILFFCIGLQYMAFAQTPSKADSLRAEGNLVGAIAEYDKLYQIDSTNIKNIYKYACAYALLKQRDSAFYFLNKATVGDSTLNALTEPDFYFLIEDERWETFTAKEVAKVEAKHGKYPNLELSRKLWTMVIKDQAFYYQLKLATKQWGYKSPMVRVVWELKKKLNTQNLVN